MNPFDLMKNMQNIQSQMQQMQSKLAVMRATGSAGAGMVDVTINGKMEVQSIASAFNAAVKNIQDQLKTEATSLAGGMNL